MKEASAKGSRRETREAVLRGQVSGADERTQSLPRSKRQAYRASINNFTGFLGGGRKLPRRTAHCAGSEFILLRCRIYNRARIILYTVYPFYPCLCMRRREKGRLEWSVAIPPTRVPENLFDCCCFSATL